ncbi:MAG: SAM-dependent methyltransferase [Paracoccaceae bacterium]
MAEAGTLKRYLIGQFGRPSGPLGWLAGRIMAARGSNRLRNRWTVDLMELQPGHLVLEIGYGPGLALAEVCARLPGGRAVGLDHSPEMHRMAAARNRAAVNSGLLTLRTGSAEAPTTFDDPVLAGPFNRIFAVNVAMFWHDPVAVLQRLAGLLAAGGGIYLTFQPRSGERTDAAALTVAETLSERMCAAGLSAVRIERLTALSPMAVCVIGSLSR